MIKHFGTFDISIGDKKISLKDDDIEYVCISSEGEFTGNEVAIIVSEIVNSRKARNRIGLYKEEKKDK